MLSFRKKQQPIDHFNADESYCCVYRQIGILSIVFQKKLLLLEFHCQRIFMNNARIHLTTSIMCSCLLAK